MSRTPVFPLSHEAAAVFIEAMKLEAHCHPETPVSYRLPGGAHLSVEYYRPMAYGRRSERNIRVEKLAYLWRYEARFGNPRPIVEETACRLLEGVTWEQVESEKEDPDALFREMHRQTTGGMR